MIVMMKCVEFTLPYVVLKREKKFRPLCNIGDFMVKSRSRLLLNLDEK